MIDDRNLDKHFEEEWWWRHANNLWTYDPQSHTTAARTNWANVDAEEGPIRVSPFVDEGAERFRTLLVTEPWKGGLQWPGVPEPEHAVTVV